jgi:hypothetical protein
MVCCTSFFTTVTSIISQPVELPNGIHVFATHIGRVQLTPLICLTQVLYIPSFNFYLISVKKLSIHLTCCVMFLSDSCFIQDLLSWTMIGKGEVRNGLRFVNSPISPSLLVHTLSQFSISQRSVTASASSKHINSDLWHCRLGHPSFLVLSSITDPVVKNNISIINEKPCCIYPLAKLHRLPFSYSTHHTSQPFEIVHCDLWVPCFIPYYDGFKYFLTLVDCFTRSTWLYLLPTEADTKRNIESFANLVENQFNRKIKILRSDNGGNFT